jgi:hypothetical protein
VPDDAIEHRAGDPDEWGSLNCFGVAGGLTEEKDWRGYGTGRFGVTEAFVFEDAVDTFGGFFGDA